MATIYYNISSGNPPFTVSINPAVASDNIHNTLGQFYFTNIPNGNYTIEVVDNLGCADSFIVDINCTTTTTTTIEPTTTTTTTTEEVTTTTTTIEITTTTTTTTQELTTTTTTLSPTTTTTTTVEVTTTTTTTIEPTTTTTTTIEPTTTTTTTFLCNLTYTFNYSFETTTTTTTLAPTTTTTTEEPITTTTTTTEGLTTTSTTSSSSSTTTTTTIPYLEPTTLYDDRTYVTSGSGGAFCDEVNYPLNFPFNLPPTQPYDMLFDFYMGLGLTYENVEYIEIISVDSGDITYSYNGSPIYAGQIIYSNGTSSWEHGDIVKTMLNYIGCEFYTYTDIYLRVKLYGYQISPSLQWRILIDGTSCTCPTTTTTTTTIEPTTTTTTQSPTTTTTTTVVEYQGEWLDYECIIQTTTTTTTSEPTTTTTTEEPTTTTTTTTLTGVGYMAVGSTFIIA